MKHCFLTLIALLGFSYAFAQTHNVVFYDNTANLAFASIVDQDNNTYDVSSGYLESPIADGTTLYFTLNYDDQLVYCVDDEGTGDYFAYCTSGSSITIDASFPGVFSIVADDPSLTIQIGFSNACDIFNLKIDGMDMVIDDNLCKDGVIEIPFQNNGSIVYLEVKPEYRGTVVLDPIDWEDGNAPSWKHTIEVTDELIEEYKDSGYKYEKGMRKSWSDSDVNDYSDQPSGKLDVYYQRTFTADQWNTFCFPFALTQSQVESYFGTDVVFNFESATFSESVGLTIECSHITAGTEANVPYLVKPETNIDHIFFDDVMVETFTPQTIGNGIQFVGIEKPTPLTKDDKTVLFIGKGNKVYYPNEDFSLKGFRAYFKLPDGLISAPGKAGAPARFIIRNRQAPTGLNDNVTGSNASRKYMQNGRLVIENNGVRYNAQGQQMN